VYLTCFDLPDDLLPALEERRAFFLGGLADMSAKVGIGDEERAVSYRRRWAQRGSTRDSPAP
jgi:hypothetical protein